MIEETENELIVDNNTLNKDPERILIYKGMIKNDENEENFFEILKFDKKFKIEQIRILNNKFYFNGGMETFVSKTDAYIKSLKIFYRTKRNSEIGIDDTWELLCKIKSKEIKKDHDTLIPIIKTISTDILLFKGPFQHLSFCIFGQECQDAGHEVDEKSISVEDLEESLEPIDLENGNEPADSQSSISFDFEDDCEVVCESGTLQGNLDRLKIVKRKIEKSAKLREMVATKVIPFQENEEKLEIFYQKNLGFCNEILNGGCPSLFKLKCCMDLIGNTSFLFTKEFDFSQKNSIFLKILKIALDHTEFNPSLLKKKSLQILRYFSRDFVNSKLFFSKDYKEKLIIDDANMRFLHLEFEDSYLKISKKFLYEKEAPGDSSDDTMEISKDWSKRIFFKIFLDGISTNSKILEEPTNQLLKFLKTNYCFLKIQKICEKIANSEVSEKKLLKYKPKILALLLDIERFIVEKTKDLTRKSDTLEEEMFFVSSLSHYMVGTGFFQNLKYLVTKEKNDLSFSLEIYSSFCNIFLLFLNDSIYYEYLLTFASEEKSGIFGPSLRGKDKVKEDVVLELIASAGHSGKIKFSSFEELSNLSAVMNFFVERVVTVNSELQKKMKNVKLGGLDAQDFGVYLLRRMDRSKLDRFILIKLVFSQKIIEKIIRNFRRRSALEGNHCEKMIIQELVLYFLKNGDPKPASGLYKHCRFLFNQHPVEDLGTKLFSIDSIFRIIEEERIEDLSLALFNLTDYTPKNINQFLAKKNKSQHLIKMADPFLITAEDQELTKMLSKLMKDRRNFEFFKKILEAIKDLTEGDKKSSVISLFLGNQTYSCLETTLLLLNQLIFVLRSNEDLSLKLVKEGIIASRNRAIAKILELIEILVGIFLNRISHRGAIGVTMEYMNKIIFDSVLIYLTSFDLKFDFLHKISENLDLSITRSSHRIRVERIAAKMMSLVIMICKFKGNFENVANYVLSLITFDRVFKSSLIYIMYVNIQESGKNKIGNPRVVKIIKEALFKEIELKEVNSALLGFYGEKSYLNYHPSIRPLDKKYKGILKNNFDLILKFSLYGNQKFFEEFFYVCNTLVNFGNYSIIKGIFRSILRFFEEMPMRCIDDLYAGMLNNRLFRLYNVYKDNFSQVLKIFEKRLKDEKKSSREINEARKSFLMITKHLMRNSGEDSEFEFSKFSKNFLGKLTKFTMRLLKRTSYNNGDRISGLQLKFEIMHILLKNDTEHILDAFNSSKNPTSYKYLINDLRDFISEKSRNKEKQLIHICLLLFIMIYSILKSSADDGNLKKMKNPIFWIFTETKKKTQFLKKLESIMKQAQKLKSPLHGSKVRSEAQMELSLISALFDRIKSMCEKEQARSSKKSKSGSKPKATSFNEYLDAIENPPVEYESIDLDYSTNPSSLQNSLVLIKDHLVLESDFILREFYQDQSFVFLDQLGYKSGRVTREELKILKEDLGGFQLDENTLKLISELCSETSTKPKYQKEIISKFNIKTVDAFVKFQSPKKKKNLINLVSSSSKKKKPKTEALPSFVTLVKHESLQQKTNHNSFDKLDKPQHLTLRRTHSASKAPPQRKQFYDHHHPIKNHHPQDRMISQQQPGNMYLGRRNYPQQQGIRNFNPSPNKKLKTQFNPNMNMGKPFPVHNHAPPMFQNNFKMPFQNPPGNFNMMNPVINFKHQNQPQMLNHGNLNHPPAHNFQYFQQQPISHPPFIPINFQHGVAPLPQTQLPASKLSKDEIKKLTNLASQYQKQ